MDNNEALTLYAAGKLGAEDAVRLARNILEKVTTSRYIPFVSPNPSSTEADIRMDIDMALWYLNDAVTLMV